MKTGKVYLTGGGCGDAGLITLRAFQLLRSCEVLIYDSLVSEELLLWTAADCEKIYVGKRYGRHAMQQSEINALLVAKALAGKMVVRLKGGDPYLFGRGGEEFLAVREAGICCEVIPGISSAIAVPAAAGIPVTHRGLASSVTVVTGTAAGEDGQTHLSLDFDTLARLHGTLVILMGMHHLQEIAEGLIAAGKSPDTSCAVIMEGTTARQRCMRSKLCDLAEEARIQGFSSPAVIVVGEVAELRLLPDPERAEKADALCGEAAGELCKEKPEVFCAGEAVCGVQTKEPDRVEAGAGLLLPPVTVGVTGTPHFAAKLSEALTRSGAQVWDMSFVELRQSETPLPDLREGEWLVFTSANGVSVFLDKMRQERRDVRTLCGQRIAVIGPGTAAVLAEAGIYADYQPEIYDTVHLAQGLTELIAKKREEERADPHVLFLRARQGSHELLRIFTEKRIPYRDHALYELEVQEKKRAAAVMRQPDYIVFGSAMNVRTYFEGLAQTGIVNTKSRYVCIGRMCAQELQKYIKGEPLIAAESSVSAIVECLCEIEKGRMRSCIDPED